MGPNETLGSVLKAWRSRTGLTQTSLGSKVRQVQSAVSRWEKGTVVPEPDLIEEIWQACQGKPKSPTREELDRALALRERPTALTTPPQQSSPTGTPPEEPSPPARKRRIPLMVLGSIAAAGAVIGVAAVWPSSGPEPSPGPSSSPTAAAPAAPAGARCQGESCRCKGESCTGVEPNGSVCAKDADTVYESKKYGVTVQLRYSPSCRAAWAKMSNTSEGDRIIITRDDGHPGEEYGQQRGHDAHTKMTATTSPDAVQACALIRNRGKVCAEDTPPTT
uniref:DUF2690 domain-containing protein n=1 Tax=Streptomyces cellulosae TaxID=1968 RepID=UPI002ED5B52B